jgi:cytoskeletal protein CcmA (bactofilin family)/predicted RNA-binding Zn-ribbon protein involved in translation (DUF1610 family)
MLSFLRQGRKPDPVATSARAPSMPLQITGFSDEAQLMAQSAPQSAKSPSEREPPRQVVCFDCQHVHKVSAASTSSLCPNCGCYIDLRDVIIRDRTTQRIRTRGDVVVEKKAALLGTSITCGNLTVHGQVSGSIYSSGEVSFKTEGKVLGEVRCRQLIVEKKSQIHFLQPVHAVRAEITGEMTGHLHCTEYAHLGKRASLTGSVQTKILRVDPGATLEANIKALPRPLPTAAVTTAAAVTAVQAAPAAEAPKILTPPPLPEEPVEYSPPVPLATLPPLPLPLPPTLSA